MDTTTASTTFSTPSDTELVGTRVWSAPIELVWRAWTTPELLKQWQLGTDRSSMPLCELDLREGGRWRMVWREPGADPDTMEMAGVFLEVTPPGRVVQTENWGGDWPETTNTLELFREDEGRTRSVLTIHYPSKQARDRVLALDMSRGWAHADRLLEGLLEELQAGAVGLDETHA